MASHLTAKLRWSFMIFATIPSTSVYGLLYIIVISVVEFKKSLIVSYFMGLKLGSIKFSPRIRLYRSKRKGRPQIAQKHLNCTKAFNFTVWIQLQSQPNEKKIANRLIGDKRKFPIGWYIKGFRGRLISKSEILSL